MKDFTEEKIVWSLITSRIYITQRNFTWGLFKPRQADKGLIKLIYRYLACLYIFIRAQRKCGIYLSVLYLFVYKSVRKIDSHAPKLP